jgi:hypothetical protein
MKIDDTHKHDDARWAQLMEAEAFGELSGEGRDELERLADQDEDRRRERELLAAIGTLAPLDTEPGAEDERLIDGVLEQHGARARRRRPVVWLAAAVVMVPIAAAAAYGAHLMATELRSSDQAGPAGTAVAPADPPPGVEQAEPEAAAGVDDPAPLPGPSAQAPASAPRPSAPGPSAAALLAQAQQARSAREYGKAIRVYRRLVRRYPASGEARLAQVSLAQLQLAQGNAGAALGGFDAYLRSGGALSQEAHYGKIQALRTLGRRAEEHAEIRRFLARYPRSLHAAALKRRLGTDGERK